MPIEPSPIALLRVVANRSLQALLATVLLGQACLADDSEHFSKWQSKIKQTNSARETEPRESYPVMAAWCDPAQHEGLLQALRSDSIRMAPDFIQAIAVVWCDRSDPAAAVLAWKERMALPFLIAESSQESWIRNRASLQEWSSLGIPERPFGFSLSLADGGATVYVSTSREGGGDDFVLRLIGKRWLFVKASFGGAC